MPLPVAGFVGQFLPQIRGIPEAGPTGKPEAVQKLQSHTPTLAPPRPRHKTQNWCSSTALLFKLWTFGSNSDR